MLLSARDIVWMPIIYPKSFAIGLNPEFAKACAGYALSKEMENTIVKRAWTIMGIGAKGAAKDGSYFHFKDTLLLQGAYYKPGDGVWLTLDTGTLSHKTDAVMYHDHNADFFSTDRLWLMHAFSAWAKCAQVLLEWK